MAYDLDWLERADQISIIPIILQKGSCNSIHKEHAVFFINI